MTRITFVGAVLIALAVLVIVITIRALTGSRDGDTSKTDQPKIS